MAVSLKELRNGALGEFRNLADRTAHDVPPPARADLESLERAPPDIEVIWKSYDI
jgi:hypothetical protein